MSFLDKMKQAKDLYGNMKKVQSEISKIKCEGTSKNGKIIATVGGNHNLIKISIDHTLPNDSQLEESIKQACNNAHENVDKEIKTRMGGMMGSGDMKLPF
tara:strand:+ start:271 stop:570 length:300 start_codon:yes stop_codon:yes gene_type:complete